MTDVLDTPEGETEVVFLGTTTDGKGKAYAMWIPADALDRAGNDDNSYTAARQVASWYPAKGHAHRPIGGRYTLKATREDDRLRQVWFGTLKYVGQHESPLIAVFQAAERKAKEDAHSLAAERKAKEPVYMRDLERTVATLKALPLRQALKVADAIALELRRQILTK